MSSSSNSAPSAKAYILAGVLAHIDKSDYVAKARYLDEMQAACQASKGLFYGACDRCYLHFATPDVASKWQKCVGCTKFMGCTSPYCEPRKALVHLKCGKCKKSGFCAGCITTAEGCMYCGKLSCRKCAFAMKAGLCICSAQCAKDNAPAKRAKTGDDDDDDDKNP